MLIKYLKFGMCNCSEFFMVKSRYIACASVMFVDFSEHSCGYLLMIPFYGIKLINAFLIKCLVVNMWFSGNLRLYLCL